MEVCVHVGDRNLPLPGKWTQNSDYCTTPLYSQPLCLHDVAQLRTQLCNTSLHLDREGKRTRSDVRACFSACFRSRESPKLNQFRSLFDRISKEAVQYQNSIVYGQNRPKTGERRLNQSVFLYFPLRNEQQMGRQYS